MKPAGFTVLIEAAFFLFTVFLFVYLFSTCRTFPVIIWINPDAPPNKLVWEYSPLLTVIMQNQPANTTNLLNTLLQMIINEPLSSSSSLGSTPSSPLLLFSQLSCLRFHLHLHSSSPWWHVDWQEIKRPGLLSDKHVFALVAYSRKLFTVDVSCLLTLCCPLAPT